MCRSIAKFFFFALSIYAAQLANLCIALPNASYTELLLSVELNNEQKPEIVTVLKTDTDDYLIPKSDMLTWRIKEESLQSAIISIDERDYVDLSLMSKVTYNLVENELKLEVDVPASYFNENNISVGTQNMHGISNDAMGAYLNYNISAADNRFYKTHRKEVSALPEFVFFNQYGVGTSSFYFKNSEPCSKSVRLDTNWTQDFADKMMTVRIGDSITRPTIWSGAARFAGLQIGTNFDTQPTFIRYPQPSIRGSTAIPSNLDLFLNNVKIYESKVQPGPFAITNIPVISGAGTVVVQAPDITGNIRTYEVPYYSTPTLLRDGLSDYSFELGKTRVNYGIKSNTYRDAAFVGTYRYGINDYITSGVHTEALEDLHLASFDNAFNVWDYGVVNLSAAGDNSKNGKGYLTSLGFQRQSDISYGVQGTFNSKHFTDISTFPRPYNSATTLQSFLGIGLNDYGSINFNYTDATDRQKNKIKLMNMSYQKLIYSKVNMIFSAGKDIAHRGASFAYLSFNIAFGEDKNLSTSVARNDNKYRETIDFQKRITGANGFGYRLQGTTGDAHELVGEANLYREDVALTAGAAHWGNASQYYANAQGSVVAAGGAMHLSRQVTNCMAVVKVASIPNIKVYKDNQLIGTTDHSGKIIIHNIPSYTPVTIRYAEEDLPMSTIIGNNEQRIFCKNRSAVLVDFDIAHARGLMMRLIDSQNNYLPMGQNVMINGFHKEYILGYDGLVFIEDIKDMELIAGKTCNTTSCCHFRKEINNNETNDILDIGNVQCEE